MSQLFFVDFSSNEKSISPGNSVFYTRQGITLPLDDYSYRRRSLVLHSVGPYITLCMMCLFKCSRRSIRSNRFERLEQHHAHRDARTPKLNIPALVRPHPLYILLRVSRELCF